MTTMNPAPQPILPRYGIRDDEMTRPCVVLFDWTADEATVIPEPLSETFELIPDEDVHEDLDDEADEPEYAYTLPRGGLGRKPGTVALAAILGVCVAIGLIALFAPVDAQAGAESAAADVGLR